MEWTYFIRDSSFFSLYSYNYFFFFSFRFVDDKHRQVLHHHECYKFLFNLTSRLFLFCFLASGVALQYFFIVVYTHLLLLMFCCKNYIIVLNNLIGSRSWTILTHECQIFLIPRAKNYTNNSHWSCSKAHPKNL